MIAVLKKGVTEKEIHNLIKWLESMNVRVCPVTGEYETTLSLIGDTSKIDVGLLESNAIIDSVKQISDPFKESSRKIHPKNTVIDINGVKIGDGSFQIIAGPCSVESYEQILEIADRVKSSGAAILRGGAFKPRTSPYDFQGLHAEGLKLLKEAKKATGLPVVSEIMNINDIELFEDIDVIQVGARNMQNFDLLRELGQTHKPVLLKRGLGSTIKELLMSAEYIISGGNDNVILCERGIRTFESFTRNTLDLSAVPVLHEISHLPVIVDPSHATGLSKLVEPMALAATACGAEGLMIEVHNNPEKALSDGAQSITPEQFDVLTKKAYEIRNIIK